MATAVEITITADASGVITVTNQAGEAIRKIPAPSRKIKEEFDGIESSERRAHIAGQLFTRTLGIEMPRALETVIARSAVLGPLLKSAFNLSIIGAGAAAFGVVAEKIGEASAHLAGYTEELQEAYKATVQASQDAFLHPTKLAFAGEHLKELRGQIDLYQKAAQANVGYGDAIAMQTTLESKLVAILGYKALKESASIALQNQATAKGKEYNELLEVQNKLVEDLVIKQENAAKLVGLQGFAKIAEEHVQALEQAARTLGPKDSKDPMVQRAYGAIELQFQREKMELIRSNAMEAKKIQDEVAENELLGIAKIKAAEADHIRETGAQLAFKLGLSEKEVQQTGLYQAEIARIHQQTYQQIAALNEAAENQIISMEQAAQDASLKGDDLILAHKQRSLSALVKLYATHQIDVGQYIRGIGAVNKKANAEIDASDLESANFISKLAEERRDAEAATALASVAPWQRAYAQIEIEAEKRVREIDQEQRQLIARYGSNADAVVLITNTENAKRAQVWADANQRIIEENRHMAEQLGGDLQSVFDDITSGNIGKRILSNIEKLFFQIVAQWILSLNMMKSAAGSIFGSIVFGPGSTGSNVFGGGGSPLGFLGGLFGGGSQSSLVPAGAVPGGGSIVIPGGGSMIPSLQLGGGLGSAAAGTSGSAGGFSASNALTSATIAEATGAGPAGNTIGSAVNGALSAASGTKMSGFMGALQGFGGLGLTLLGGLGGKVGQLGSFLSSATMMGLFAHAGAAAPFLAALGPALLGFGIGSNFGPLGGALAGGGSGFAAGALIGLAGGPIGAIVGGIIGAIAGLFGGIFGSGKRKRQANSFVDNTVLPNINQIVSGFDSFQIDSSSAIQQLEQIRTDSQKELSKLKGQGKDVFRHRVDPAVADAESHIRNTQSERDRRAATVFGPPQFATGGMFMVGPGANRGLAMLHDGEIVINAQASKKEISTLAAINAGKNVAQPMFSIGAVNITTTKPLDKKYIMSDEFQRDLLSSLSRAKREGKI